ncbi:MAG: DUF4835 family protein, partial [Bacteroidota bacterium]
MKKYILLFVALWMAGTASAQELQATVKVVSQKASQTDPKVFQSLETAMEEFFNNTKWTEDVFEQEELIQCSFQLTINSDDGNNNFSASMAIQSSRPIYGSNQETPLLTHNDPDVNFTFEQFQPLQYTPNSFADNLTSILSFYAYLILGFDYDSFSPLGGEKYFQSAQDIITTVPASVQNSAGGWSSVGGRSNNRSRYWLIENILNPRVQPYRQAMYNYHRQSLDIMSEDVEGGKVTMLSAIESVGNVNKAYPNAMIIQTFTNTKSQEIIEIFKLGNRQQKT